MIKRKTKAARWRELLSVAGASIQGPRVVGPSVLASMAVGAVSGGAVAVGAMAIGRLAIADAVIRRLRAQEVQLGTVRIERLEVAGQRWAPSQG